MASRPSILLIGATGNTGKAAVRWLSRAHAANPDAPRLLALTRDTTSAVSKELGQLPHVEMIQKLWSEIDVEWLQQHRVTRVYLAHPNPPTQFEDESRFLLACRDAQIEYLVKLSTSPCFVNPSTPTRYARSHWAAEQLLLSPEFSSLPSTVLQPTIFLNSLLDFFLGNVKAAHEASASQELPPFDVLLAKDASVAAINPEEVGEAAGALLALSDPSAHFRRTYSMSGPADVKVSEIVGFVEEKLGVKLKIEYESEKELEQLVGVLPAYVITHVRKSTTKYVNRGRMSIQYEPNTETSSEIIELGISRMTTREYVDRFFQ